MTWKRFLSLLAHCEGNPSVTDGFSVAWSFDYFAKNRFLFIYLGKRLRNSSFYDQIFIVWEKSYYRKIRDINMWNDSITYMINLL